MSLLRRTLGLGAVLVLVPSALLVVIPRTIVEGVMAQEQLADDVWIRLFGAGGIALGLVHVLIIRKLDELWWWVWAFAIFDALSSVIVIAHAAVGLPTGSAAWPWWVYGATSVVFTALYVVGLAKAGQVKPFA